MHRIAVIGDRDSILGFRGLGVETFAVAAPGEAEATLRRLAGSGYALIFVTEGVVEGAGRVLDEYATKALPVVVTIPDAKGSRGVALAKLRRTVERAVGADILFGKEG